MMEVPAKRAPVTVAGYNPFIGKIQGVFATFVQEPVITGCVPQANFYTLYNQVGLGALSSPADCCFKLSCMLTHQHPRPILRCSSRAYM